MYKAMIVDDEQPALDVLKLLLERTGQICIVGAFQSAVDAVSKVQILKPDVVFIDIEMPQMSGLELAERIIEISCNIEIIFVTAHDQYALEAFRVNAIDYILKPLTSENVTKVIQKLKKINPRQASQQMRTSRGRIYCFERFLVYGVGSDTAVKWRTSKTEELFALLVQNVDRIISKWKIAQALWPEFDEEKSKINMHTTIYNLKKTLLSAKIDFELLYIDGGYRLTLPDVYVDTAEFLATANAALTRSQASIQDYELAYALYTGRYLEDNEYSWAHRKSDEYATKYHQVVAAMFKHYMGNCDYLSAESLMQKALTIDPIDDTFNEMHLQICLQKKDKAAFIIQYNKTRDLYAAVLGIELNASMQLLYNEALKL